MNEIYSKLTLYSSTVNNLKDEMFLFISRKVFSFLSKEGFSFNAINKAIDDCDREVINTVYIVRW
jgi:hypothetical protein